MEWQYTLGLLTPGEDGALVLDLLAEEAKEHVEAADGEEEEGGDQREVIDVVREDRRTDEALEDAQGTKAKVLTEDGEVGREEARGPADLREDEDDDLEDDQQAVDNRPEHARRLIRDGAATEQTEWSDLRETCDPDLLNTHSM